MKRLSIVVRNCNSVLQLMANSSSKCPIIIASGSFNFDDTKICAIGKANDRKIFDQLLTECAAGPQHLNHHITKSDVQSSAKQQMASPSTGSATSAAAATTANSDDSVPISTDQLILRTRPLPSHSTTERFVNSVQFPISDRLLIEAVYDQRTEKPRAEVLKEHFIKEGRIDEDAALRIINGAHSKMANRSPPIPPRLRELRYWDSYWIVRGLLASGMTSSVRNICKNFAELIDRFGFVPARNRIFYSKRSQPPFLTLMVYDYFGATGDAKFLKEMLPTLEKELDFWRTKRSVEVIVKGKKKTFYQYKADTNMPRPEAFCQDVDLVKNMTDPKEKAKVWRNIASASESGWDFSSRWIRKDEADKKNAWKLNNLMTTRIVPMDLNALMAYHGKYQPLNEAFYGSAAMPLFVRFYDTIDLGTAERMFHRLELFHKQHKLLGHPFGVPVSITVNSSQQWDFPNILPPSQHMLIEGLRRSSNKR
uniref:Trehalase n=1 Tax=Globodera rostochiensis TaxID=31243 RepID=A0A914H7C8_GLORO